MLRIQFRTKKSVCACHISPRSGARGSKSFQFPYIMIFQRWQSLEPPAPLLWEIDICAQWLIVWNWIPNNFYLKIFFLIQCEFLAALSPKVILQFLYILMFRKSQSSETPNSPRGIRVQWWFYFTIFSSTMRTYIFQILHLVYLLINYKFLKITVFPFWSSGFTFLIPTIC